MSKHDNTIIPVHNDEPVVDSLGIVNVTDTCSVSDSNQRTRNQFRPRVGKGGGTSAQLRQYAEVTLGGGSLRKVVALPEGEDENEWLAVNSGLERSLDNERQKMLTDRSGGFLQPNQPALRRHYRVLLSTVVSRNESYG
jgi:hypothetical protein